jgi:CubicO group peptidase (beta-lactamase class C family)
MTSHNSILINPVRSPLEPAALGSRVNKVLDHTLADKRLVGAVVLVAHDGQLVYERAAGLADRTDRRPMRTDTLFRLSSVSKPIVSVAALVLIAQGRLGLEDPVDR